MGPILLSLKNEVGGSGQQGVLPEETDGLPGKMAPGKPPQVGSPSFNGQGRLIELVQDRGVMVEDEIRNGDLFGSDQGLFQRVTG